MSASLQNQRRGQSLMAHGRVKRQQQSSMFFELGPRFFLNELADGEMRIFRGMAFQISRSNNQRSERVGVSSQ